MSDVLNKDQALRVAKSHYPSYGGWKFKRTSTMLVSDHPFFRQKVFVFQARTRYKKHEVMINEEGDSTSKVIWSKYES